MQGWHATWSSDGRHPLFPEEERRRKAVRAIARVAGNAVSLFCIVDDHVHVVLFCTKEEVGRVARSIRLALTSLAAVGSGKAFVRPVADRSHVEYLAGVYILRQSW